MKKTFKRLGTMFLAVVMAVSVLCTGAFADDVYIITIHSKSHGHTYQAYQVFTGTLSSDEKTLSDIQWGSAIENNETEFMSKLRADTTIGSDFTNKSTAAEVADVLATYTNDKDAKAKAFAAVVGAFIVDHDAVNTGSNLIPIAAATVQTDTDTYTMNVDKAGYYFVRDMGYNVSHTEYILSVAGDIDVTAKDGTIPDVRKEVQNPNNKVNDAGGNKVSESFSSATTAEIGETVNFKLTGTLPDNYDDYQSYKYVFHDTLSKGLEYKADSVKVYIQNDSAKTLVNVGYQPTYRPLDNTITVEFNNLKAKAEDTSNAVKDKSNNLITINKDSKIIVEYSATLNKNAVAGSTGNDNKVYLEYSNDPNATGEGTTGKTPEDVVKVYTFQLNITKVDAQNKDTKLKDAKFVLSTQNELNLGDIDDSGVPTNNKDQLIAVSETSNKYTVNDNLDTDSGENSYVMSTSDDGTLNISGLKPGKYYLYETKAPDGYNRRTTAIPIEIQATVTKDSVTKLEINADNEKETNSDSLKWTAGDTSTGIVSATITNSASSLLPSTGGMGTKLFYVIGGLLMAGAVIVLVIKKRRSSAE